MSDRPAVPAPNTDVGCQARAAINAPPTQAPNTEPARGEAYDDLARIIDTLADAQYEFGKCSLCPLGAGSVCFPNCAWWKSGRKSLAALAAREETT